MDCGNDTDVEMIGSPVLPSIKTEPDDEIDETECYVVVGDSNEDAGENSVENNDTDPMDLLELLNKTEQSNVKGKRKVSTSIDGVHTSEVNEDSNAESTSNYEQQNYSEKAYDRDQSHKSSYDEEITDIASEIEDDNQDRNEKRNSVQQANEERFAKQAETKPWLCKDGNSLKRVFCLYCNMSLKYTNIFAVLKHERSNLHQDRAIEYLDFMENSGSDVVRIKTNRDFDGNIKREREKLEEKIADYRWDLWTKSHDWMIRTKENCFISYCKFCCAEVYVSSIRQRKSHEESQRHQEGMKKYPSRRKTISGDALSVDSEHSNASSDKEIIVKSTEPVQKSIPKEPVHDPTKNEYFEKSKSSADLCRCKLCDITMFTASFFRHSNSNLHKQNLAVLDNPVVPDKIEKPQWQEFAKLHPWLIEDPSNPMEAYCKYCEKRISYGNSAAKRLIHEHSAPHRANVKKSVEAAASKAKGEENELKLINEEESCEENPEDDEVYEDVNESKDGDSESDQDEGDNETGSKSGNDTETGTETISSQRSKSEPDSKPSWLKPYKRDGKYVFCRYCKILLQNIKHTILTHCKSLRHVNNARIFKKRSNSVKQAKAKNKAVPPEHALASDTTVGRQGSYPWLVKFKSNTDIIFCKYCRFRFSAKANRSHHQNTRRHIEAAKKFQGVSTAMEVQEQSKEAKVQPLKVIISRPIKRKISQNQLRSMFDWLQFKKGMQLNYGYCTICEKSVFIPSAKYGYKHKRTGTHLRARNTLIKRQEQEKSGTLKRNLTDTSEKVSEEPPPKRFKPCSLQNAIETAKRLTGIHLEMLKFVRSNGQGDSKTANNSNMLSTSLSPICLPVDQTLPKMVSTNASTIADLNATLSPIVHAATQANKRDPFDLFFNSISETIKILPPDLASEAKLKVMQVIFELETRAQQRQNQQQEQQFKNSQPEQQVEQQQPTTELNITPQIVTPNENISNIPSLDPLMIESPESDSIEPETARGQVRPNQQLPQLQQQLQLQKIGQVTCNLTTATLNNSMAPRKFYIQKTAGNSSNGQHHPTSTQSSTPLSQANCNNGQVQRNIVSKLPTTSSSTPIQANTIVHAQRKAQTQQPQQLVGQQQQQNMQTPTTQRDNLVRHRIVTNQLNNLVNNVNQRINVNNPTTISLKTNTGLTISSVNSLAIDNHNNNGNSARVLNRAPQIRTVPLSSLTKAKYQSNNVSEEPQFHQIQLNSSTQSKIITIDTNNFQRR